MKAILLYLLQVVLCTSILYGYYHFFLRNKKFHQYNRFYLLITVLLAFVIPLLNIPVYFTNNAQQGSVIYNTLSVFSQNTHEQIIITSTDSILAPSLFTWQNAAWAFYMLVCLLVFIKFIMALYKLRLLLKRYRAEKLDRIYFINTNEEGTPYSFFRWLFWNSRIPLKSEDGEKIFRHELFHIQQNHSRDIVFMELITVILWINPFFHLIKKELKAIHEFLADQFAINNSEDWKYAELILMQALGSQKNYLTNPFFHNQIKRRIAMITTSQKPKYQYLRKVMVLPVAALVITLFAFKYRNAEKLSLTKKSESNNAAVINRNGYSSSVSSQAAEEKSLSDTVPAKTYFYIDSKTARLTGYYKGEKIESISFNEETLDVTMKMENGKLVHLKRKEAKYLGMPVEQLFPSKSDEISITSDSIFISTPTTANFFDGLLVLDDVIQPTDKSNKEVLDAIEPGSIKSINILKGPSATALYGEKGKNGVIEIRTRNADDVKKIIAVVKKLPDSAQAKEITLNKMEATRNNGLKLEEVRVNGRPLANAPRLIFEKMEIEPAFPKGEKALREYLASKIDASAPAKKGCPPGVYTVKLKLAIQPDGEIYNIRSLTNNGYGIEEQVVAALKEGPKWEPAMQNGKKVSAYKYETVTYVVGEQKLEPSLKEVVVTGHKLEVKSNANEIEKLIASNEIKRLPAIYPNPASNKVTIPFNTNFSGEGQIFIYDLSSRLVSTSKTSLMKGLNNLTVKVDNLKSGMYVIAVTDSNKQPVRFYKVVKE